MSKSGAGGNQPSANYDSDPHRSRLINAVLDVEPSSVTTMCETLSDIRSPTPANFETPPFARDQAWIAAHLSISSS